MGAKCDLEAEMNILASEVTYSALCEIPLHFQGSAHPQICSIHLNHRVWFWLFNYLLEPVPSLDHIHLQ